MDLNFLHLYRQSQKSQKPTFVFRDSEHGYSAGRPGGPLADDEDEEEERQRLEDEKEEQKRQQRDQAERQIAAREDFSRNTRQLMRECLASDSPERQNLVYRLLNNEGLNEAEFLRQLESIEQQDHLWKDIFDVQRDIRKKIQEMQWRTESYMEIVPRGKEKFEKLLKDIHGVNRQDSATDRGLKSELHRLTQPSEDGKRLGILTDDQARQIYLANPLLEGIDKTLKKFREIIEAAPGGKAIYRKLLALKREELRSEREFNALYNKLGGIITDNLRKVRSKAERERLIKNASRSVGVSLKEGTVIEFEDPDILLLPSGQNTVTITGVIFNPVLIRDKKGGVVDQVNGCPQVKLSNGAKMPIGRFKKWIDAGGGKEQVHSLKDAERILGLEEYGIEINDGTELFYPRRYRDERGNIVVTPTYVRITETENGNIRFSEPVSFAVGHYGVQEDELRETLTVPEFVKWWRRYGVEMSVSLRELQELLKKYNAIENKLFGYELKENPPIAVEKGEELKYSDESGLKFRIQSIDTDGVYLDNGQKMAFPEFFYWVKNNHVISVPEREKSAPEKAEEQEKKQFMDSAEEENKMRAAMKQRLGAERVENIKRTTTDRETGTVLGKLKNIWWSTQWMSLQDLWAMTLEVVEFVKRKHGRRSKGRYGEFGERLPGVLGTEFARVRESAENEEVNKYKEAMEHWGVEEVKRTLHKTNSRDEAKACVMTLLHHGEMRWDDHRFWETMNRLTARYTLRGAMLYIPKPHLIKPGESGEDKVVHAIDAIWGSGHATQWFQENVSKYNGNKKNFEYKFKNLESDPKGTGGPAGECERLLKVWIAGGYVNPQEYEAMIDGAIKFGKMGAEAKMFYIIAGCVARQGNDPHGETLLSLDRPGELDSVYLNQFPLLDFFTQETVIDPAIYDDNKDNGPGQPKGGWGKERKLQLQDYMGWKEEYFPDDFEAGKPGAQFSRFLWEKMMMSEMVRTRISKGIRNAENMDHDDAQLFIPPTTPGEIDGLTTGPTGQKKYFTNEGYANAYPGFNQYITSLSYSVEEETNVEARKKKEVATRNAIISFIRLDAILDNRFLKKEGDHRARLDDHHFDRHPVVDESCNNSLHRAQLRNLVLEIGAAYGQDWASWLYGPKTGSIFDKKELEKQTLYEKKIDSLKELIPALIDQDNGKKMFDVIKRARSQDEDSEYGLRAIQKSKRPSRENILALKAKARVKEEERLREFITGGGGHGGH